MRFVADEGVDRAIVVSLRNVGYEVIYIAEDAKGITDDEVLEISNNEDCVLITRDKDFGELVYRLDRHHSGVILNRLAGLSAERKAEIVVEVLLKYGDQLLGSFTVIQPGMVRIRKK